MIAHYSSFLGCDTISFMSARLIAYVQFQRTRAVSPEEIRSRLVAKGWPLHEIESALRSPSPTPSPPPTTPPACGWQPPTPCTGSSAWVSPASSWSTASPPCSTLRPSSSSWSAAFCACCRCAGAHGLAHRRQRPAHGRAGAAGLETALRVHLGRGCGCWRRRG